MDAAAKRAEVLRELIKPYPSIAEFSRVTGIDATYVSQILNGHRNLGEKAALKMEQQIGLDPGHFARHLTSPSGKATSSPGFAAHLSLTARQQQLLQRILLAAKGNEATLERFAQAAEAMSGLSAREGRARPTRDLDALIAKVRDGTAPEAALKALNEAMRHASSEQPPKRKAG